MTRILSEIIYIDKSKPIEQTLFEAYGEIVRWAIVDVSDKEYKISYSYEVKEAQTN